MITEFSYEIITHVLGVLNGLIRESCHLIQLISTMMMPVLRKSILFLVSLLCFFPELFLDSAHAEPPLQHVTLQLKWYPQFQFAGYYMAAKKGFYKREGLDVTIKSWRPGINPIAEVESNRAQFGVGSVNLLVARAQGVDVVALAAIIQHSCACVIVPRGSSMISFTDLRGRKIGNVSNSSEMIEFKVVMMKEGMNPKNITFKASSASIRDFTLHKVDAIAGYISNEPEILRNKRVPVTILRPINYGVDFYGDCLFTTERFARENPSLAFRFKIATIEGWEYAFDHPHETINYLLSNYNNTPNHLTRAHLEYEESVLAPLIIPDGIEIGYQNPYRWEREENLLFEAGVINHKIDLNDFIWNNPEDKSNEILTRWLDYSLLTMAVLLAILLSVIGIYYFWNRQLKEGVIQMAAELNAAHADLDMRGRTLHSLLQLSQALTGPINATNAMRDILVNVRDGFGAKSVSLFLVDREEGVIRRLSVSEEDASGELTYPYSKEASMPESLIRAATAINPDSSLVHSPLQVGAMCLGLLSVEEDLEHCDPLDDARKRQLQGFADEIALALFNARLLVESDQQQTRLSTSNKRLQALLDFSQEASLAHNLEDVIRSIAKTVRQGYGFDRVGIFLSEENCLRILYGTDEFGNEENIPSNEIVADLNDPESPWHWLLNTQLEYHYTDNMFAENGMTVQGEPVRDHLLLILRSRNRIIGVIAADNGITRRRFFDEDVSSLLPFARHAAAILENARLISALKDSEEFSRTLIASISETIFSIRINENKWIIPFYFSPQIENMTGYSPQELTSDDVDWNHIIFPDDLGKLTENVIMSEEHEGQPYDFRYWHKNGQVRWGQILLSYVKDDQGEIRNVYGTFQDITERKELEERWLHVQKMETIGTLAGGIAHEFNNLLAIMSGNIELAKMDVPPDNPAMHSLNQNMRAVQRAADLTRQLLTFSRKTELRREKISLNSVVQETIALLQPSLPKEIELSLALEANPLEIIGDAGQIEQILINLCVNARDAMPNGGKLTIRTKRMRISEGYRSKPENLPFGSYVRIQVHDTGLGMDVRTRQRIFEPFFTTKPMGHGTGLGLAMAYAIVQDHQGWIELESVPDIGTLFSIYLPAAQPWEDPYAINGSQVTPPIALIALPESLMRDQFVEGLKKQGYTPIIVNNATETLDLFWTESELLGLIVCATSIFEMKATTLITHMHEYNASVPVILLTDVEAMQQLSGMTPREYKVLSDTSDAQTLLDAVQKISGGQLSGNRV